MSKHMVQYGPPINQSEVIEAATHKADGEWVVFLDDHGNLVARLKSEKVIRILRVDG